MKCLKKTWLWTGWKDNQGFALLAYRLLAYTIASGLILLYQPIYKSIIPPPALVVGVGIYTLIKAFHPLRWYQNGIIGYYLLGADIALCIFLVMFTGGIYSPFLLYTLAPVLTAALLLDGRVTSVVAGLSVIYVITGHTANPFFATELSLPELSYFFAYMTAAFLVAYLPYLVNINLRQRLQSQDILRERQRLSREIHDGIAQTLSSLNWQAQLIHYNLIKMGIDLRVVKELCQLTQKAQYDIRESLELLRTYTGDTSFLPCLKDNLIRLKQDNDIDFHLDIETEELHMENPVELELLRICQEALTNIRMHSGAHNIWGRVRLVDGHIAVTITDDGHGFNNLAYYQDMAKAKGHGLAVMQERAESVGGRFRVLSLPGKGTEIQVEVPAKSKRIRLSWPKR